MLRSELSTCVFYTPPSPSQYLRLLRSTLPFSGLQVCSYSANLTNLLQLPSSFPGLLFVRLVCSSRPPYVLLFVGLHILKASPAAFGRLEQCSTSQPSCGPCELALETSEIIEIHSERVTKFAVSFAAVLSMPAFSLQMLSVKIKKDQQVWGFNLVLADSGFWRSVWFTSMEHTPNRTKFPYLRQF